MKIKTFLTHVAAVCGLCCTLTSALAQGEPNNAWYGTGALQGNGSNIRGPGESAFGVYALGDEIDVADFASGNTAVGVEALYYTTNDANANAVGAYALYSELGFANGDTYLDAIGYATLSNNTTSFYNDAIGHEALYYNTTGSTNTANGGLALHDNTIGTCNVASGFQSLASNTNGNNNTGCGFNALYSNKSGSNNTAISSEALFSNTTGADNTACGDAALYKNTTGAHNVALGYEAGYNITTGTNNIHIANGGASADTDTIRIGTNQTTTYIAGIHGATAASGVEVYVDTSGQLGTLTSSVRFKQNIRSMDDSSAVLLLLHPVTFQYKAELDPKSIPQFGLVAEEVEQVDPDLVARDAKNQIYSVRYQAVNAMLLNEFLKQHHVVEEHRAELATLKEKAPAVDSLEKRLGELEQTVQLLGRAK